MGVLRCVRSAPSRSSKTGCISQTGKVKDVYRQIVANPQVALCGYDGAGRWLRIEATAVADERVAANAAVLAGYPSLQQRYAADDGNCAVFYLKDATATFSSFSEEPRTIRF
jgi:uncharacterized pyridoxamine 5'-phosphate oxidase family protein